MSAPPTSYEQSLVVAERAQAADETISLTLRHPEGEVLPDWQPGAHVELLLGNGLTRTYSLCGDPADGTAWRIAVLRTPDSRGGSACVHDKLHAGDRVEVRGPRNNFPLRPARRYLFVAGGIGITPLLPMVAAVEAAGTPWHLLYGGRSRASMAFTSQLAPYGQKVSLRPQDEYGLLDLDAHLGEPDGDTLVYCCGPEPLLAAIEEHCRAWPTGALQMERFTAKEQEAQGAGTAFEVVCAESGVTVQVPPKHTVLSAVRAAGIDAPFSCTDGICGTCETEVLEGEPDHRDSVLSPEDRAAGETMMICVSRARGPRLVLDL
ncbi:PDR/VanB family oxidoreductase [Streptomyces lonegramiae]|uniref:PDR/VanB family oxidoreductase n=1 Tax=Streptomyces lonegramiae TaxID=3075524 RepID=A0ABU2X5P4_9ACTN|nr:PDR/VanB family oxidoreductase [Streptomyces sp. DSM 41529]MDT0541224.1 PDR/VanB family oxidoreductase [Streptomyces sp. DSM 41529]